ncbi:hypothetical protein ABZY09_23630 [Streptomyces sp. NPDC002928]|uniref:hypothetical protein n=1 Tax=Streptomyces sp. NPDC002928 TaxID=3154440 RepID=UPI0033BA35DB
MNLNPAQPGDLTHTPADAASGAQLVIENLDGPADTSGVLFTVTYSFSLQAPADSVA